MRVLSSSVATLLLALGCSATAPEGSGEDPGASAAASAEQAAGSALSPSYTSLCCGTRTTLVDGIASAENLLFTHDGRLLVSGDDGIYEVRRDAGGAAAKVLLVPSSGGCRFSGMVEVDAVVYATCYDFQSSTVLAGALAPSPGFRPVLRLDGVLLANGLSADSQGRLYVAETLNNQIVRLTPSASDPFTIESQEVWLPGSGLFTDGMKVFRSFAYFTDFAAIKRARILPGGAGPAITLASAVTFFDDIYVDQNGILAADYFGNAIRAYGLLGAPIAETPPVFTNPSSVLPAAGRLGLGEDDLVVTEKGANRVAVYSMSP